jgi:hypothetical protein
MRTCVCSDTILAHFQMGYCYYSAKPILLGFRPVTNALPGPTLNAVSFPGSVRTTVSI